MATKYHVTAKLFISSEEGNEGYAFGSGLIALLRGVEESGSIYRAAKDMRMAYSKAWTLINTAEERIGTVLIDRNGAHGSALTKEGARLLDMYEEVQKDVNEYASKAVERALKKA